MSVIRQHKGAVIWSLALHVAVAAVVVIGLPWRRRAAASGGECGADSGRDHRSSGHRAASARRARKPRGRCASATAARGPAAQRESSAEQRASSAWLPSSAQAEQHRSATASRPRRPRSSAASARLRPSASAWRASARRKRKREQGSRRQACPRAGRAAAASARPISSRRPLLEARRNSGCSSSTSARSRDRIKATLESPAVGAARARLRRAGRPSCRRGDVLSAAVARAATAMTPCVARSSAQSLMPRRCRSRRTRRCSSAT